MKQFPDGIECEDEMIKAADGSEVLLKSLWDKFPAIRAEFTCYEAFISYGKALTNGQARRCQSQGVSESKGPAKQFQLAN
ncbi:MAG TPA: hypothetical protein PKK23_02595 [Nitrospirales bacterium]|nr:hypothetical protein [Nitrospiraceae bacterium]HNP27906.1 hypothetical protein [Nitrospirales bacterium]